METMGSRYEQQAVQKYARAVRRHLPAAAFQRTPARLLSLPLHWGIILAPATCVGRGAPPGYLAVGAALLAGHSWGCLGFLAHEALHHALVKRRSAEKLIGYAGFGLYCLSPTLWSVWYNQAHHGH